MKIRNFLLAPVLVTGLALSACDFGEVEQGRCVAFDGTNKITVVLDSTHDQHNPKYDGKAVDFVLPEDPKEIGPLPTPGRFMLIDLEKKCINIYNAENKSVDSYPVEFVDTQTDVKPKNPAVKGKTFPIINQDAQTITVYSTHQDILATFKANQEFLDMPSEAWVIGDEVRMYYKENAKHQALRFMNISKTNIFKK